MYFGHASKATRKAAVEGFLESFERKIHNFKLDPNLPELIEIRNKAPFLDKQSMERAMLQTSPCHDVQPRTENENVLVIHERRPGLGLDPSTIIRWHLKAWQPSLTVDEITGMLIGPTEVKFYTRGPLILIYEWSSVEDLIKLGTNIFGEKFDPSKVRDLILS